ncbi:hypothetical protein BCR39DRAFT_529303 [Naematelia encephala]|uniref:NAD-dependent epimerase/dehydratase domain-containing protein n=1 Tax=Naematelia encephala TaxID=71784 RepID=A0A1Y2B676_9TREE|nr:hypothetical protein BCR39DRAFT_529303 [Naematelia encephala]
MKVLVLGASGFIGYRVAQAFVRAGHIVYGQTRSESTGKTLPAEEIVPVVCDPLVDAGRAIWGPVASQCDVVVDALAASGGSAAALATFNHFLSLVSKRPRAAPKPTYIYTGGLWSLSRGDGGLESWTDERQPRSDYNPTVAWRAEIEDVVLLEDKVNGTVIRPPIIYGYAASYVGVNIFEPAYKALKDGKKTFETTAAEHTRWQTIHTDDLADLYVRVGERGNICKGQTFLAINPASERLTDILDAVVRITGLESYIVKQADPKNAAWVSTLNAKASLGAALVGWQPKRMSLVDGMPIYWPAFVASKDN